MQAWVVERHGGPEVLKWKEVDTPEPGPGEARVRVGAVGLNRLDLWVRNGVPGHPFPLPMIPGCDISGTVDCFGPLSEAARQSLERAGLRAGTRVLVNPVLSCGHCEACLSARPQVCPEFGITGETTDGGCAEYVIVPVANLISLPGELSFEQAAVLPIAYVTAWNMLMDKIRLEPGQLVLIQAGGSGVSSAGIQIAKMIGAEVITTVGSPEKAGRAKALGADHVIDYKQSPFRDEVKRICKDRGVRGVDAVLEHVGGQTFLESLKCLKWGGRLATCGSTTDSRVDIDLKPVFFKNIEILGSTMGSKADVIRVMKMAARGLLKPLVDASFPLERLPDAYARLESREVFGKIVVTAQ